VAWWLTRELYSEGIHAAVQAGKVNVAGATASIRASAYQEFGGQKAFDAFTPAFRTKLLRVWEESDALTKAARTKLGTAKTYWDKNAKEFPATTCLSHILVATEDEARAALTRLNSGEDFAAVAQAVSTDTGSKAQGGDLGCSALTSFVKEFAEAAAALPVDKVSEPVKSQFGFHLIKVAKKNGRTFDEAAVEQVLSRKANDAVGSQVLPRLAGAKVDPRYGAVEVGAGTNGPRVVVPAATAAAGLAAR
jgi:parvulin-like peptidyl-prolyl isomerase